MLWSTQVDHRSVCLILVTVVRLTVVLAVVSYDDVATARAEMLFG